MAKTQEENGETLSTQVESLANIRGCGPGNRDVCGGEDCFEDP